VTEVYLPSSLRVLFPGAPRRVNLDVGSVDELISDLDRHWPGMRERICHAGEIRQHVHVYVNGERATLDTAVPGDATVHVIPAMSGG
jgi:molybdopterin synthase sulfur carrier subunit